MQALVDLGREHLEVTNTSITRKPVTTTFYDLMTDLQNICGPDNDDLVVSLVVSWLLSGRITFPEHNHRESGFYQGGF